MLASFFGLWHLPYNNHGLGQTFCIMYYLYIVYVASPISSRTVSTCLSACPPTVFHPTGLDGGGGGSEEGAPLCSFGDSCAGTWNSCCAPKTNYRGPWPPARLNVRASRGRVGSLAPTDESRWGGQVGDTAGPGYRFGRTGRKWDLRSRRGVCLMFYLYRTV